MRIRLERSGGVAGPIRRPPVAIDVQLLNSDEQSAVLQLIEAADLPHLPAHFSGAAYPDAVQTTVVLEDGAFDACVTFRDGDGHPAALEELANLLWKMRKRA
jgi:hypothetical protein